MNKHMRLLRHCDRIEQKCAQLRRSVIAASKVMAEPQGGNSHEIQCEAEQQAKDAADLLATEANEALALACLALEECLMGGTEAS